MQGSIVCLLGGCLMNEYQKKAYPDGYQKVLPKDGPSNLIASRLSNLRHMHAKGVTKVKIPSRQEQAKLEYLQAEMRGEEIKADVGSENTSSAKNYFSRFLPKLPGFGSSPKPNKDGSASKAKSGKTSSCPNEASQPKENLLNVLMQHHIHKR